MWKYIKPYIPFALLAALGIIGEVTMDLIQPTIMSRIVDDGVLGVHSGGTGNLHTVWTMGLLMILLVALGGLSGTLNNASVHYFGQNLGNDMRKDCFRRIMSFSFPQMDRFGTGSLVTRVTNDITQVQNFVANFVRGLLRTTCLTFGSIFFLFRLNHTFGLIILGAFPFVVGVMALCIWKAGPLFPKLQAQLDEINAILQEDISGLRIIKACVQEIGEKIRFGKANDAQIKTQLRTLVIFAFMNPAANILMYLAILTILWTGSRQVFAGSATPGVVMAAITYATQVLDGVLRLLMVFQTITRGLASWHRVKEILDSEPELKDGAGTEEPLARGLVEFRDVSFSFPGTDQPVLEHIDLTIHAGETVAIMGATGSGKTALVSLIPRFYDVTEGAVLVDGVDVRQYRQKDLRDRISIVLQKAELFSVSIRENIAWGKPGARPEEISIAARIAQAEDFILSTEQGYDTMVAQRGMSLSGGQKQRLSVARAVVRDAEILIFDDSTSALDLRTEAALNAALKQARPGCTKVIVAQRIASVRQADRIVVLEHGRIAAAGSHEALLDTCPIYRDIYDSQMGKEAQKVG
ncbi:MAG: ABC transporter ATP-binding protein [Oscillospiraceae bacterium]|nr:ABC transporter ATP-binding protein [Oscillospiraceae bacterium]